MNNALSEFRFWCQKVLPLVYDDSLSYYEVLCKLREIVNRIIQEIGTLNDRIDDVYKVMQDIQNQIDNLIENIDSITRDEVIKILNEWLADGTIEGLVQKTVSNLLHIKVSSYYNVDAMKKGDLINGDFAMTAAYNAGYLGGGYYYITSTATYPESSWFIKLDNGNYALLISEYPEIYQFNFVDSSANQVFTDAMSYCATFHRNSLNLKGQTLNITEKEFNIPSYFKLFNGNFILPVDNYTYFLRSESTNQITFENLSFTQGITYNGRYSGNFIVDGVTHASTIFFLLNCDNVNFTDCRFDKNNTGYFILPDTITNLVVRNCSFKNMMYAGVYLFGECKDALFENCIFDTNLNTTAPNCYLLGTGNDNDAYYTGKYVHGFTVKNCQFLNNPRWEGLETHGASDVIFDGNVIKNCLTGIMCASDERSNFQNLKNIVITNNFIELQEINQSFPYISIRGSQYSPLRNVVITNNVFTGLIAPPDNYAGLINLVYADGVMISNNVSRETTINNVISVLICSNVQVLNNTFEFNMITQSFTVFATNALMNAYFDGNHLQLTNNRTVSNLRLLTFNNTYTTNVYFSPNNVFPTYNWQKSVLGWDTYGVKGEIVLDEFWRPKQIATNEFKVGGPKSAGTCTINAGSEEITFSDVFCQHIAVGSFITITGGASGGNDLFTYVYSWKNRNTALINPPPSTSITNAAIVNGAPTFVDYYTSTPT